MLNRFMQDGIAVVTTEDVLNNQTKVRLIDVRTQEEFHGELGHIKGSELITLGPDLVNFLNTADKEAVVVFVCRSGQRSGSATFESQRLGFKNTANMIGGMLQWNASKYPIEK